jgi:hypothetical protein
MSIERLLPTQSGRLIPDNREISKAEFGQASRRADLYLFSLR